MVRIFRKPRGDAEYNPRVRKYLLYAAGELVLVVAGILIALQINNWNEDRIAQDEIRQYALNLSEAIARDMQMLEPVDAQIRSSIRLADTMADYLRDRRLDEITNEELFFLTKRGGYRPYAWNRAEMEQLKAAGGLRLMRNRMLAQRISDYDALAQHLDQDYHEDEQAARDRYDLTARLVDLNYAFDDELDAFVDWDKRDTLAEIEQRLARFRSSPVFARIRAEAKPLLSSDLSEFRRLGNLSNAYARKTIARPRTELPRLRQYAAEIQALIDEEYR